MKTTLKILHWTPRILCILAILFISMFAMDAFNSDLTIWKQFSGFLIHMIPSFILLALLVVAWKWELVGGIIFSIIGLIFTPIIFRFNYNMNHSVKMSLVVILFITFPFIVTGLLFIISYLRKKREQHQMDSHSKMPA